MADCIKLSVLTIFAVIFKYKISWFEINKQIFFSFIGIFADFKFLCHKEKEGGCVFFEKNLPEYHFQIQRLF